MGDDASPTAVDDRFFVGPDDDPDRYEIIETIRSGGEGTVARARFLLDGTWQTVAAKTLLPDRIDDLEHWADRWRAQVSLLRLLADPGVVGVHDGFIGPVAHRAGDGAQRPRTLHLIMNFVEGQTLVEWRDHLRGPAAFHDVAKLLGQVGAALDYLSSGRDTNGQAVVHGDVKPANVIVTPERQARLVDFGLARLAHTLSSAPAGGTPGYTAPEVLASGQYSPASDRYALGGVAYFLFVGQDPPDRYDLATMRARLEGGPLLHGRSEIANHTLEMLAADPAARPSSAAGWGRQFGLASTTIEPGGAAYAPAPTDPLPPRRRRRWRWAVAAALLVAVAAGGAVALGRGGAEPEVAAATTSLAPTTTARPTTTTSRPRTSTTRPPGTSIAGSTVRSGAEYLADRTILPDYRYYRMDKGTANVGGTPYTRSLLIDPNREQLAYVEYDLSKNYATLDGVLGLRDDVQADSVYKIEVYGDGQPLLDHTVRLGDVIPFTIDVKDVLRLRLQVTDLTGSYPSNMFAVFADPKLTPA